MANGYQENLLSAILFSYFSEKRLFDVSRKIVEKFEQKSIPFELIIIDDGSQDNFFEIAEQIAAGDPRIRSHQLMQELYYALSTICRIEHLHG